MLISNPAIIRLRNKLELYLSECKNPILISYIKSVLSINLINLASKYGKGLNSPIDKLVLPKDWDLLKDYKEASGVYQFTNKNDSYVGLN